MSAVHPCTVVPRKSGREGSALLLRLLFRALFLQRLGRLLLCVFLLVQTFAHIFFSRSSDQENAACAKSPVAIPPAIIEPGFVAVAQAQAGAVRPGEFRIRTRVPGAAVNSRTPISLPDVTKSDTFRQNRIFWPRPTAETGYISDSKRLLVAHRRGKKRANRPTDGCEL